MIDCTVYVYAKDEKEAKRYAAHEEDYQPWEDLDEAIAAESNPEQCRDGEKLYSVTTIVSYVARLVDTAPAGQKREQGESAAPPSALDAPIARR